MKYPILFLCFLLYGTLQAQTGLSVSPPRVYFETDPGQHSTQKIRVTNESVSNSLDLAISLGDWEYNVKGDNMMYPADSLATSCASWVSLKQDQHYFSLKPGESKEVEVSIATPQTLTNDVPVHTAMLYVTQMNPIDDVSKAGANMKISVRSGIKLYHRTRTTQNKKLEVQNMLYDQETNQIAVHFENLGNIWTDGILYPELLHTGTGEKITLDHLVFYTMPGNYRETQITLPQDLQAGDYVATIIMDYGNDASLEMAELTFAYEK
ncbi:MULTISPECIES: fimbrial biogenesis chaperone [Arenibacter]|uniref:fimbrial biogenesis chaperone n=1 Tax=Arenibacter TaxID=178469 RepID=UPI000A36643E|nr:MULTISPECIES: hypothetical protein [Arenibacter]